MAISAQSPELQIHTGIVPPIVSARPPQRLCTCSHMGSTMPAPLLDSGWGGCRFLPAKRARSSSGAQLNAQSTACACVCAVCACCVCAVRVHVYLTLTDTPCKPLMRKHVLRNPGFCPGHCKLTSPGKNESKSCAACDSSPTLSITGCSVTHKQGDCGRQVYQACGRCLHLCVFIIY